MSVILMGLNLYRIQLRMIFGPKHRFRKEYDEALDVLNMSQHWLYLYDSLDGPNGEQVCVALKNWIEAYQEKKDFVLEDSDPDEEEQVFANEKQMKREIHLLIYGQGYEEGDGYESD